MSIDTTEVVQLLVQASRNGITIALKNDQLHMQVPKGSTLDPALLAQIRSSKQEIIHLMRSQAVGLATPFPLPAIRALKEQYAGKNPLSFAQTHLWVTHQLTGSVNYHLPLLVRLKGPVDRSLLEYAFNGVIDQQEALRSVFQEENNQVYQHVLPKGQWRLGYRGDLVDENLIRRYQDQYTTFPFNLERDYMLRAVLIKLNQEEHLLLIVMHHIAVDGWSVPLLVEAFAKQYRSGKEGGPSPALTVQYADYAIWQRCFAQEENSRSLGFWTRALDGVTAVQLPLDYPRPTVQSFEGDVLECTFDLEMSLQLEALAREANVTLFMLLLTVFKVLLAGWSGQEDICVGTPFANRPLRATEGLIGFFANLLALRTRISPGRTFGELLQQVKAYTLEAYSHQQVPFEQVVDRISPTKDISRHPVFQVVFVLQNTPAIPDLQLDDLQLHHEPTATRTSKFDLCFEIAQKKHGLHLRIEYCTKLFAPSTIGQLAACFGQMLRYAPSGRNQPVGQWAQPVPQPLTNTN